MRVAVWAAGITERRVADLVPESRALLEYFLKKVTSLKIITSSSEVALPDSDEGTLGGTVTSGR